MGDNLNTEVWRCVRAGGSLRDELVKDVLASWPSWKPGPAYDRITILDAIDELIAEGSLKENPAGRIRRNGDGESRAFSREAHNTYVLDEERADALGMTPVEERLDNAWPRTGGRREIIRALASEVEEMLSAVTRNS